MSGDDRAAGGARRSPGGAAHAGGHLPDEGGLAGAVLPHQQHHGLVLEVGLLQRGRVELMEAVVLLQRQQLAEVEVPQPAGHRLHHVGAAAALPAAALLPQPAEHPAEAAAAVPPRCHRCHQRHRRARSHRPGPAAEGSGRAAGTASRRGRAGPAPRRTRPCSRARCGFYKGEVGLVCCFFFSFFPPNPRTF